MRILSDTNVLLRMAVPAHPLSSIASKAIETLHAAGHELFIVPQNIYEFWTVATRTTAYNGLGMSPNDAEQALSDLFDLFRMLRDERAIYEVWLELVTRHSVAGVKSYDARLAAAMRRHQLDALLTFNPSDFRRYAHVNVLEPEKVLHQGDDLVG